MASLISQVKPQIDDSKVGTPAGVARASGVSRVASDRSGELSDLKVPLASKEQKQSRDVKGELASASKQRIALDAKLTTLAAKAYDAMHSGMTGWGVDGSKLADVLGDLSPETLERFKQLYREKCNGKRSFESDFSRENISESMRQQWAALERGDQAQAVVHEIRHRLDRSTDTATLAKVNALWRSLSKEDQERLRGQVRSVVKEEVGNERKREIVLSELESKAEPEQSQALSAYHKVRQLLDRSASNWTRKEEEAIAVLRDLKPEQRRAVAEAYRRESGGNKSFEQYLVNRLSGTQLDEAKSLIGYGCSPEKGQTRADAAALWRMVSDKKEQQAIEFLEGKSKEQRDLMLAEVAQMYGKEEDGLSLIMNKAKSGTFDSFNEVESECLRKLLTMEGAAHLSSADKIRFAAHGFGTRVEMFKSELKGKSSIEIAQIRRDLARENINLDELIDYEEGSGRDGFELKQAAKGEPQTLEERARRAIEQHAFERSGLNIADLVSEKGNHYDRDLKRVNELLLKEKKREISGKEREELERLVVECEGNAKSFAEANEAVAETAAGVLAAAAATAVVVGTGGAGLPLVIGVAGAAVAGGASYAGSKAIVLGKSYDSEMVAGDVAIGAAVGAADALTVGAAGKGLKAAGDAAKRLISETLRKVGLTRKLALKTAVAVQRGSVYAAREGTSGAVEGGVSNAVNPAAFSNGITSGLAQVAAGVTIGAAGEILGGQAIGRAGNILGKVPRVKVISKTVEGLKVGGASTKVSAADVGMSLGLTEHEAAGLVGDVKISKRRVPQADGGTAEVTYYSFSREAWERLRPALAERPDLCDAPNPAALQKGNSVYFPEDVQNASSVFREELAHASTSGNGRQPNELLDRRQAIRDSGKNVSDEELLIEIVKEYRPGSPSAVNAWRAAFAENPSFKVADVIDGIRDGADRHAILRDVRTARSLASDLPAPPLAASGIGPVGGVNRRYWDPYDPPIIPPNDPNPIMPFRADDKVAGSDAVKSAPSASGGGLGNRHGGQQPSGGGHGNRHDGQQTPNDTFEDFLRNWQREGGNEGSSGQQHGQGPSQSLPTEKNVLDELIRNAYEAEEKRMKDWMESALAARNRTKAGTVEPSLTNRTRDDGKTRSGLVQQAVQQAEQRRSVQQAVQHRHRLVQKALQQMGVGEPSPPAGNSPTSLTEVEARVTGSAGGRVGQHYRTKGQESPSWKRRRSIAVGGVEQTHLLGTFETNNALVDTGDSKPTNTAKSVLNKSNRALKQIKTMRFDLAQGVPTFEYLIPPKGRIFNLEIRDVDLNISGTVRRSGNGRAVFVSDDRLIEEFMAIASANDQIAKGVDPHVAIDRSRNDAQSTKAFVELGFMGDKDLLVIPEMSPNFVNNRVTRLIRGSMAAHEHAHTTEPKGLGTLESEVRAHLAQKHYLLRNGLGFNVNNKEMWFSEPQRVPASEEDIIEFVKFSYGLLP